MQIVKITALSLALIFLSGCATGVDAQEHPNLLLTRQGVEDMVAQLDDYPLFHQTFLATKARIDAQIQQPIVVPVPKDPGGGYTHEQHKSNYKSIHDAGLLYQLTNDGQYAEFARDMLLEYAELFPTLGRHPVIRSSSPGRLFWQSLNEAVWLLYSIQGYDAIIDSLDSADREIIEQNLFIPLASFLSDGQPGTFDRIHNHGTWAAAAVGMTGYVLGRDDFVHKALYGLDGSGNSGFLKQLDLLFSPDGYYNEGPYYQRYALMPFVIFAQAIENNDPQLEIFKYRDEVLLKAIYGVIQLSYNNLFFPLNDAIKDKGLDTTELLYGVSIAYGITGDPALLSVARSQQGLVLTGDGLALARGLAEEMDQAFPFTSMQFGDGPDGQQGALSILRSSDEPGHQALVMKNTSQGLGHGHFDKLSWLFYDNGYEIVSDYGAARFLNIEAKNGGGYLPENESWAKQTVAHNTLVVDQVSHFDSDADLAELHSPKPLIFDIQQQIELISAEMHGAYPGVDFIRTMAMIKAPDLQFPLFLDVLKVSSDSEHQYDLPLHFQGHIIDVSYPLQAHTEELQILGPDNGYQHLWLTASGALSDTEDLAQLTWIKDNRFYTNTSIGSDNQEFLFTRLGANDPNFNLRPESILIQRVKAAKDQTFVSLLEPHGEYNPVLEYTLDSSSQIADLQLVQSGGIDFVRIETLQGKEWGLAIAYDSAADAEHSFNYAGQNFVWQGFYQLFEL